MKASVLAYVAVMAVALAGCGHLPSPSPHAVSRIAASDITMGSPSAPVTLIEYGSVACPKCVPFHRDVLPAIKAKYIDNGDVRYVYRPMLTGVPTIAASGELLAECTGTDYFAVNDAVLGALDDIYAEGFDDSLARPVLLRIASDHGLDEDAFNTCVTNEKNLMALSDRNDDYLKSGVNATPTFFIDGREIDYNDDAVVFESAIAAAVAKAKK